ncbi:MAG: iron-containing alcohol dehydrogenase [Alphaproteobacteria bacterium]|jgi:alcohol dehydrogenase class IV|nr:iron-containing alcohol dehydrogenase [Alphaproteobacteria bacterium]
MSKPISGNWNFPTAMRFGPGVISQLAAACRDLGMTAPLLITDQGLADMAMVRDALAANDADGLPTGLYSDVQGNPTGANVEGGIAAYKAGGHDGVIAFGGGSALDAAKAVALMVAQDRPIWDFEDVGDNWTRVQEEGLAPVVAVPTTSGTGSEVGRSSVITNSELKVKKIIFHPTMVPGIVLSDPELTVGLPPHITAATGIDAFVHCFEALCVNGYHPMADGIALEGMRLIADALPKAFVDGGDIDARADMLTAAAMGATAFQKGLGAVHALAHPIGAHFNVHHGLANAIFLPYVMQANRSAIADKVVPLARLMNLPTANFDGLLDWVLQFRDQLGIPHTLADIDLGEDQAEKMGALAHADPVAGGNPISLGVADYTEIFRNAVNGKI